MESATLEPAIIISSGRCGSTLLSNLIAEQPDTLSVQEFLMWAQSSTGDGELDGAAYWSTLSSPRPELATLFRIGLPTAEVCYPEDGRWADNLVGLPRILATTLPRISSEPDQLYDRLAELVPDFPAQPMARHHRMFLDLLTSLTAKRRWVERSGGSSHIAAYLLRNFPTAKIVYLTRGWADTAASMSRHSWYQLLQLRVESLGRFGLDPFQVTEGQPVAAELECYLPDRLTAQTLRERGRDVERFRGLCAFLASQAEQAIADARPRELLTMRYEDLVNDPVTQLERLGRFLDFDDWQQWAHRMFGTIQASSGTRGPAAPIAESASTG